MKNSSRSFASDLLFHQIALVSAKPSLTTTIMQEIDSSSEIMFPNHIHPERELTIIVVVQCDFTTKSAILIETM